MQSQRRRDFWNSKQNSGKGNITSEQGNDDSNDENRYERPKFTDIIEDADERMQMLRARRRALQDPVELDIRPISHADFRELKYWERFFQVRGPTRPYEFMEMCPPLLDVIVPLIGLQESIVVAGSGTSRLSERLYDMGRRRIKNVDFCKTVVEAMANFHKKERPCMDWLWGDVRELSHTAGVDMCDVVLDKATLETLRGEQDDEEGKTAARMYLEEVKKVLKQHQGRFIVVTTGEYHVSTQLLSSFPASENWGVEIYRPEVHYAIIRPFVFVIRQYAQTHALPDGSEQRPLRIRMHFNPHQNPPEDDINVGHLMSAIFAEEGLDPNSTNPIHQGEDIPFDGRRSKRRTDDIIGDGIPTRQPTAQKIVNPDDNEYYTRRKPTRQEEFDFKIQWPDRPLY